MEWCVWTVVGQGGEDMNRGAFNVAWCAVCGGEGRGVGGVWGPKIFRQCGGARRKVRRSGTGRGCVVRRGRVLCLVLVLVVVVV